MLGEGPVSGGIVAVDLLGELQDGVSVVRASQLPQGGLLDAGVGLLVAEPAGLPGQRPVDHGDGEEVVALVGPAGVAAPLPGAGDADGTWASQSVYLSRKEGLAQLGEVVVAVGLQGAHGLLDPRAEEDVVRGPLTDEGLLLVELPRGGPASHEAVVELSGPGELAVGAGE